MRYLVSSLSLGLVSVIVFILLRVKAVGIKALVLKVMAAIFYILLALSACYMTGYPKLGIAIVIGGIFGLLGDVFLDQKYIHPEEGEAYTHMGFTVFGIGHIAFMIGLVTYYDFTTIQICVAVFGALLIAAFTYFTQKPFKLDFVGMKLDVVVYSFILGLSTMLPLSWMIFNGLGDLQINIYLGGMLAFLLSDLVLSQIYFGDDQDQWQLVVANYVLYFTAQYAIALSIVFIK